MEKGTYRSSQSHVARPGGESSLVGKEEKQTEASSKHNILRKVLPDQKNLCHQLNPTDLFDF